MYLQQEKWN